MSDIQNDTESQDLTEGQDSFESFEATSAEQKTRNKVLIDWVARFHKLSAYDQAKWEATHVYDNDGEARIGNTFREPDPGAVFDADAFLARDREIRDYISRLIIPGHNPQFDGARKEITYAALAYYNTDMDPPGYYMPDPFAGGISYAEFEKYNEFVRSRLGRSADHHRGYTLDELAARDDDSGSPYVLADAIPKGEITIGYGKFKIGKSRWLHKLAVTVASVANGLPLDGEPVQHGRVLYVSLDPGARGKQVGRRLLEVRDRIGAKPGANFILVDTPLDLTNPASVASLLDKHPGEFELVVIDSLYRAIPDGADLVDARTMKAAINGAEEIAFVTGAAVFLVQHTGRGDPSHPYGSNWQEAGASSLIKFEGNEKTNVLTAKVEFMKNGQPREAPFRYRCDGACLQSLDVIPQGAPAALAIATAPHQEMLALMPTKRTSVREARKLVEHLLTGTPRAREQLWFRARTAWENAGLIEQRDGMLRRAVA